MNEAARFFVAAPPPAVTRLALATVLLAAAALPARADGRLKTYTSRYYVLHTDLAPEHVREATLRIERMAETYHKRTRGFAGEIKTRLPFYLFRDPRDYYAAGGLPGSAGVFTGEKLMAIAGPKPGPATWQLVQHEGFHQFAHAVIRGDFPIWVNEGMAEYFGDSVYTGDGYITGVIPPDRLKRLQTWMRAGNTLSINEMMNMPHEAWNSNLSLINYDQAWSMIYFLAHADNGRYQDELNKFIREVGRGTKASSAWAKFFGHGTQAFERKWRQYWLGMSANPTADRYAEATVAMLTSFYARAFSKRQVFTDFSSFVAEAKAGTLKAHEKDWLPPSLLRDALAVHDRIGTWRVRKRPGRYEVICKQRNGVELVGSFTIRKGRVADVDVKDVSARARRD